MNYRENAKSIEELKDILKSKKSLHEEEVLKEAKELQERISSTQYDAIRMYEM
jgi:predicted nucleic acid-binding protein